MGVCQYIHQLSCQDGWALAFRKRNGSTLYEGNSKSFIVIPNSIRYWRADPFIIKHKGKNYLFAEMYDRYKQKGVIGVAEVTEKKVKHFKVCLDLPFHLSYPCLIEKDNEIYMIPECCQSGSVSIYRCLRFPIKWEKCDEIINIPAVDTTPFNTNDNKVAYFTSKYEPINGGNDNLYIIDSDRLIPISENNFQVRCAGHIINDGRRIIRPCQDDSNESYGGSLFFRQIDNLNPTDYKEHNILRVLPPNSVCADNEVSVELDSSCDKVKYIGVHTYNSNEDYEVIDLLISKESSIVVLYNNRKKLYNYLSKRIKRRLRISK